jgi:hypothetical protein
MSRMSVPLMVAPLAIGSETDATSPPRASTRLVSANAASPRANRDR